MDGWIEVGTYATLSLLHVRYTISICLRLVSASRLTRRLKRGVLGADALLRAAEASWLQTLARSSCSSDWANGPSASNSFPARPRVRPLTYLGLP